MITVDIYIALLTLGSFLTLFLLYFYKVLGVCSLEEEKGLSWSPPLGDEVGGMDLSSPFVSGFVICRVCI